MRYFATLIFVVVSVQIINPVQSDDKDPLLDKENLTKVSNLCEITKLDRISGKNRLKEHEDNYRGKKLSEEMIIHLREAYNDPEKKKKQLQEKYGQLPEYIPLYMDHGNIFNPILNIFRGIAFIAYGIFDMIVRSLFYPKNK